jgi:glutaredoxin 3
MKYTRVLVYATSACLYCKLIIEWLNSHNIQFIKIFVDRSDQAALEMIHKTNQMGVPVIIVEYPDRKSEIMIGFDQSRLEKAFGN